MRLIIAICSMWILTTWSSTALAWGDSGHRTVCEIALRNLTPAARAEVDRLLGAHPVVPVAAPRNRELAWACTYPDNVVAEGPGRRSSEHYVNYPRSTPAVTFGLGCGGATECILAAIVADAALLRSPHLPDSHRAVALMFLGHWIGDIHQPLHASFADDRGGNDVRTSGLCAGHLHSAWDTCLLRQQAFANAAEPSVGEVRALAGAWAGEVGDSQRAAWLSATPWQWAAESHEIAIQPETGYCVMVQATCRYSASQLTLVSGSPRSVTIDDAYADRATPIIRQRVTQAGVRLAHVLNLTLDPAYRFPLD